MNKVIKVLTASILIILMLGITGCAPTLTPPPVSPPSPPSQQAPETAPPQTTPPPATPPPSAKEEATSSWQLLPPPYHMPRYLPEPVKYDSVTGEIQPYVAPPPIPPEPGFTGVEGKIFLKGYEDFILPPWYYGLILVYLEPCPTYPYPLDSRTGSIGIGDYTYAVPGQVFRLPIKLATPDPTKPQFWVACHVYIYLPGWAEVQYENIPIGPTDRGKVVKLPDTILERLELTQKWSTVIYTYIDGEWVLRSKTFE